MNIKMPWKDAPPEVQMWYLQQVEAQEAKEAAEAELEANRRGQSEARKDPFSPKPLTRPDGTIYRPEQTVSTPNDQRYRDHMREVKERLAGER